ncbi:MAG: ISAs1 family transposase [Clostridia bacterium]|nr:ISAs1 family transposase [Clostridia bacterium]
MGETETTETRYAITSLKSIEAFADAMRRHWSIENGLHDCLDVSFREDHSHIRKDHAPENMAVIRHLALSALKHLPVPKKTSMKRLREICAYDTDLLDETMDFILL